MRNTIEIENIEAVRLRNGIDDAELRKEIGGLGIGDFVRVTFLTGPKSYETLSVRITSIRGTAFRGKLAGRPALSTWSNLRVGSLVTFTSVHIHSIAKGAAKP